MERKHSKPWDPHHILKWVPTFSPAHLRTWPTLCLHPGDQEGQHGVQSCQPLAGILKCGQSMWRFPISRANLWCPGPYGRTTAKLLSGSKDPDVTALSEVVKAKLGITEPLPKPAPASPSP